MEITRAKQGDKLTEISLQKANIKVIFMLDSIEILIIAK